MLQHLMMQCIALQCNAFNSSGSQKSFLGKFYHNIFWDRGHFYSDVDGFINNNNDNDNSEDDDVVLIFSCFAA